MKRLLLLTAAALAVAALAAAAAVLRPGAARGAAGPAGTVTTTGHGSVHAVPDRAQVSAGVQAGAATAADALARDSEQMARVIAALRAAGGRDLQTQEVLLWPRTDASGAVTGYVASNSVTATAAIARAGALVDAAVGAGANNVDGPSLTVADTGALYRAALAKAVADARAKAEALAAAGGFAVGSVTRIAEGGAAEPLPFAAPASAARSGATPVVPGMQDVTADVSVSFAVR
ncbi:MAG TPA: SIMPL domain-containing protein [Gaiellaceae bacterium]|nr:SIMPL domain-containing protein [Gaiellaceae bacterium]